ncbi:MAG: hypothetical protein DMG08_13730, partial [Acidobacteria bacterium]
VTRFPKVRKLSTSVQDAEASECLASQIARQPIPPNRLLELARTIRPGSREQLQEFLARHSEAETKHAKKRSVKKGAKKNNGNQRLKKRR